jgi:hypothetical protein
MRAGTPVTLLQGPANSASVSHAACAGMRRLRAFQLSGDSVRVSTGCAGLLRRICPQMGEPT